MYGLPVSPSHYYWWDKTAVYTLTYTESIPRKVTAGHWLCETITWECHGSREDSPPSCPTQPGFCKLHKHIHYIVSCFFGSICAICAWWAVTHCQVGASQEQIVITLDSPYMHCRLSYSAPHWTYLYKVSGWNVSINSNISCVSS